jgi:two-component system, OmpR family, sensor histidine kinase KdpD
MSTRVSLKSFNPLVRYTAQFSFGAITILVTTFALVLLRHLLSVSVVALLFFLPIGLSSMVWGLAPGVFASVLAFLCLNYFFIPPYYSFRVHQTQDLLALFVFFIVAVVINQLMGRARSSLMEATAREREANRLYELSTALSGLIDYRLIAKTLAEKTLLTFQGDWAQVSVEPVTSSVPYLIRLPDGSPLPAQEPAAIVPIETTRGLLGEICLWRQESPVSEADERLLRTFASQGALALERANLMQSDQRARLLEESDRLKSALLSSVSHELRTPLATIKASVSSLLSEEMELDAVSRRELLSAIEEETDHLNQLVGNLLDMTRIESGALKPQLRWNVLGEIVAGVVNRMRKVAAGHQIVNEISRDLPLVPVDFGQLERVLTNLISNSIKYSPPQTTINVRAWKNEEESLTVQVQNQGPHVPEADLPRIFERFYRITDADAVTGTGLGLSICKAFVEAHGGKIWASNLPEGFAFYFILPLTQAGETPRVPVDV